MSRFILATWLKIGVKMIERVLFTLTSNIKLKLLFVLSMQRMDFFTTLFTPVPTDVHKAKGMKS